MVSIKLLMCCVVCLFSVAFFPTKYLNHFHLVPIGTSVFCASDFHLHPFAVFLHPPASNHHHSDDDFSADGVIQLNHSEVAALYDQHCAQVAIVLRASWRAAVHFMTKFAVLLYHFCPKHLILIAKYLRLKSRFTRPFNL